MHLLMKRLFSTQINNNATNLWLLLFRIAVSVMVLTHGLPKLNKLMTGNIQFADPFKIGPGPSLALVVFAEVGCSILLIFGLATRFAMIPLIITMLVAIFYAQAANPFAQKELAVVYLVIFVGFFVTGAGKFSIDHLIGGKNRKTNRSGWR